LKHHRGFFDWSLSNSSFKGALYFVQRNWPYIRRFGTSEPRQLKKKLKNSVRIERNMNTRIPLTQHSNETIPKLDFTTTIRKHFLEIVIWKITNCLAN